MTDTPIVYASGFAAQTNGTLLSAYVAQNGDVNPTFTKLNHASGSDSQTTAQFSTSAGGLVPTNYNNSTSYDAYYQAGSNLTSQQVAGGIDLSCDIKYNSTAATLCGQGFTIGDDGTGNNFLEILTWQGGGANPAGLHITNHVGGTGTDLSKPSLSMATGNTYTMQAQLRGSDANGWTLNVFFGLKSGTLTEVVTGLAVPSLVMIGRATGLRMADVSSANTDMAMLNFGMYSASTALGSGTVSAAATGNGTATVSTTAAAGGTPPYSYQFQKASVTGGTVGSYANVGTAGTSLTYADTGTVGNTYSYRVVVNDSASTPATVTSAAVSYTYPTPAYGLTTSPTSLSLAQGTSLTSVVTCTGTGGYSGSPNFSVTGLPSGVSASFSPAPVTRAFTSTLTLTAAGNTSPGTATITVTGMDGNGLVETVTMALTVTPPTSGVTLDTVNNNVLALLSALSSRPASFS